MENPRPDEENLIKDVTNLFRSEKLKKETTNTAIKDIGNRFRLKKENEEVKGRMFGDIKNTFTIEKENLVIKDVILREIRNLFENEEEENYHKPLKVSSIEYESNGDRNKTLSVEEYLNKVWPYLKDI